MCDDIRLARRIRGEESIFNNHAKNNNLKVTISHQNENLNNLQSNASRNE